MTSPDVPIRPALEISTRPLVAAGEAPELIRTSPPLAELDEPPVTVTIPPTVPDPPFISTRPESPAKDWPADNFKSPAFSVTASPVLNTISPLLAPPPEAMFTAPL